MYVNIVVMHDLTLTLMLEQNYIIVVIVVVQEVMNKTELLVYVTLVMKKVNNVILQVPKLASQIIKKPGLVELSVKLLER